MGVGGVGGLLPPCEGSVGAFDLLGAFLGKGGVAGSDHVSCPHAGDVAGVFGDLPATVGLENSCFGRHSSLVVYVPDVPWDIAGRLEDDYLFLRSLFKRGVRPWSCVVDLLLQLQAFCPV
eukprot:1500054-Pyramimonas_sp.AAC.1